VGKSVLIKWIYPQPFSLITSRSYLQILNNFFIIIKIDLSILK
jgi:hypothetical protein